MEKDLIQMQILCDEWANILQIGSWKFIIEETDNENDAVTAQTSNGTATISLGSRNNTSYDIEKRILMGMLSLWTRDYIFCEFNLSNSRTWVIPGDTVAPIADALITIFDMFRTLAAHIREKDGRFVIKRWDKPSTDANYTICCSDDYIVQRKDHSNEDTTRNM